MFWLSVCVCVGGGQCLQVYLHGSSCHVAGPHTVRLRLVDVRVSLLAEVSGAVVVVGAHVLSGYASLFPQDRTADPMATPQAVSVCPSHCMVCQSPFLAGFLGKAALLGQTG